MAGQKGMRQISYSERVKIETLYRMGKTASDIARYLRRNHSTISRELRRGLCGQITTDLVPYTAYSADLAQKHHDENATAKGPTYKIGHDFALVRYLENKIIEEKYSPSAAIAAIKSDGLKFDTTLCPKTVYNYIDAGLFLRLTSTKLPRGKYTPRKKTNQTPTRAKRVLCRSIEDRPDAANKRLEWGHWEMDTVVGKRKGGGAVLLVLTERLTRKEIIMKMKSKTTKETVKCLNRMERKMGSKRFRQTFRTITVDNGSEFMDTDGMEKSCKTKGTRTTIYYCHPYSSWERGSNENVNSIIRRFIPKGTSIDDYTDEQIAMIERWINNYPRKLLDWQCAETLYRAYQDMLNTA